MGIQERVILESWENLFISHESKEEEEKREEEEKEKGEEKIPDFGILLYADLLPWVSSDTLPYP